MRNHRIQNGNKGMCFFLYHIRYSCYYYWWGDNCRGRKSLFITNIIQKLLVQICDLIFSVLFICCNKINQAFLRRQDFYRIHYTFLILNTTVRSSPGLLKVKNYIQFFGESFSLNSGLAQHEKIDNIWLQMACVMMSIILSIRLWVGNVTLINSISGEQLDLTCLISIYTPILET